MDPIYIVLITFLVVIGVFGVSLLYFKSKSPTKDTAGQNALQENLERQLEESKQRAQDLENKYTEAVSKNSGLEASLRAAQESLAKAEGDYRAQLKQTREDAENNLKKAENAFNSLLASQRESFEKTSQDVLKGMAPDVTKEVASKVDPLISQIKTSLEEYRQNIRDKFNTQDTTLHQVREQMDQLRRSSETLASSTNSFTAVLKSSSHRGKWGEVTLRRVIEAAGLDAHCDFLEQVAAGDARPDLIVKLPGDRCIIIDSKVPEFDLPTAGADETTRREFIENHAKKLKETIKSLSKKNYAESIKDTKLTPFEHVILFLPAESLLSAALEGNPDLILEAQNEKILLATPATLIGFLSAINLSWQQNLQAKNSAEIVQETGELFKRIEKFIEHVAKIRKELDAASKAMNQAIGSYERMILPQSEKVKKLGVAPLVEPLPVIEPIETTIRELGQ
jgi:DNA recombination protein RmuC